MPRRSGELVKVGKSKDGVITGEVYTRHWAHRVDYWNVPEHEFEEPQGATPSPSRSQTFSTMTR